MININVYIKLCTFVIIYSVYDQIIYKYWMSVLRGCDVYILSGEFADHDLIWICSNINFVWRLCFVATLSRNRSLYNFALATPAALWQAEALESKVCRCRSVSGVRPCLYFMFTLRGTGRVPAFVHSSLPADMYSL